MKMFFLFMILGFIIYCPWIMAQEEEWTCAECHSDLLQGEAVHYPVADACDNCHMAMGENHPDEGQESIALADSLPGLCFLCHDADSHDNKVGHGANRNGSCVSCHDPHHSEQVYLLKLPKQELCFSCHKDVRKVNGYEYRHYPFDDDCGNCHLSHSSDHAALLIEDYPGGLYAPGKAENFALCFLCHETGLIEEESTTWATGFRNGEQNLHYAHLKGAKARSCSLCHQVHASQNKALMATSVPYGKWDLPVGFYPSAEGGSCNSGCHMRKSYSRNVN